MPVLESAASSIMVSAAKPLVAAGVGTIFLTKSGVDLSQVPILGSFVFTGANASGNGDNAHDADATKRYLCWCWGVKSGGEKRRKTEWVRKWDEDRQEYIEEEVEVVEEEPAKKGSSSWVPYMMGTIAVVDLWMGGVLLHSLYLPVDQPLKQWVAGSLMLSMPASLLVYNATKEMSFRQAFLLESAFTMASFGWLSAGILWVSKSTAYKTAPLLFWSTYITCVSSWSIIGTTILSLMLTTVMALALGGKSGAIGGGGGGSSSAHHASSAEKKNNAYNGSSGGAPGELPPFTSLNIDNGNVA